MERGVFISFEGSEGCGKSTQLAELKRHFKEAGAEVLVTREPGGTPLGEEIRRLLQFAPEGEGMTEESELLLFAASRAQLVREQVRPALERGRHVLADRFLDSTTVYQGFARGLDLETVERVNAFAVGDCVPDFTVLLDMDSDEAHARAVESSRAEGTEDRMENQPLSFYEAVRRGYLEVAEKAKDRFLVVDATGGIAEIHKDICKALEDRFNGIFG